MALDVFTTVDRFGRFTDGGDARVRSMIERALAGTFDVAAGVEERRRHYDRAVPSDPNVEVIVDLDASPTATVVEVHAPDQVGLLYRMAQVFSAQELDVSLAKVATLADRVIDVFYVTEHGAKVMDPARLSRLEAGLRLVA